MGFFSSLLKGIGSVVGAVINPVGTVAGLFGASKATQQALAPAPPGLAALTAIKAPLQALTGTTAILGTPSLGQPGAVDILTGKAIGTGVRKGLPPRAVVVTGGNGKVAKRTIVQTINLDTGQVVMETVLEGAPFLMNKAVRELARTTKKLRKANRKIPTRTVKQSLSAQLTERVLDQTIQDVGHPGHHGHHGT